MLKIEIERAFEGTAFKVALAIGCLISLVQFFNVGVRHAINPLNSTGITGCTSHIQL